MKIGKVVKWFLPLSLAIIGVFVFAVGCGNNSSPLYYGPEGDKLPQQLDKKNPPGSDADTVYYSQLIDAKKGGKIKIYYKGSKHEFKVASKSIPATCIIEVTVWEEVTPEEKLLVFDFGPEGLQFEPDAKLKIKAHPFWRKDKDKEGLKLRWYNPQTGEWEFKEKSNILWGSAKFHIDHFCKYAISR